MSADNLVNLAKYMDSRGQGMQVNIFDAKTDLSKLIKKLENKEEDSITIARNGKPVAKLIPYADSTAGKRIGIAKGKLGPALTWETWEALDKDFEELMVKAAEEGI